MSPRARDPLAGAAGLVTLDEWWRFAQEIYTREKLALGQVAATAHDESLYILLHALGWPLDSDASVLRRRLTPDQQTTVLAILRRRAVDRVPAAYLTNEAWLGSEKFYVDERVIIPRSYFLEVIPAQLDGWLRDPGSVRLVADVCTGSGCLAILLARHFPRARVDAVELSPGALEVAAINIKQHRLTRRVRLWASDVFSAVPPVRYDVIISNPPYEPSAHVDRLPAEFQREPRLALDGGADGLVIVRKLLEQARERLTPEGLVMIEVGGLRAAMDKEFAALEPHWLATADGTDCVAVFHAQRLALYTPDVRRTAAKQPRRSRARA